MQTDCCLLELRGEVRGAETRGLGGGGWLRVGRGGGGWGGGMVEGRWGGGGGLHGEGKDRR